MARLGEPGNNGAVAVCSRWSPHLTDPFWCDCGMPTLWHKEFDTEPQWEKELRQTYYNTRYYTLTQEERGGAKQKILWDTLKHAIFVRRSHNEK